MSNQTIIEAAHAEAVADMVQLTDYDEIGEVLKSRKFLQGGHRIARQSLMKDVVFMIDGEEHLSRRRILARLLDDDAVAGYRDRHLVPVVERCLAEEGAAHRGADGLVRTDLAPLIQVCLHRVAAALVGIDGLESAEATQRFIGQVRTITAGQTVDWSLEDKDAVLARGHAARDEFQREFFAPSIERRKRIVADAHARGNSPAAIAALATDMLTLMVVHREDTWKSDDMLLLREVNGFITGSTQTTANGFISLALRLERWFAKHPEDRALIDSDPEFLRRAAFESLRLTVAPPARIRTATEDVTLASGRTIKAGQSVAMYFVPANMDPARFGEHPEEFNPRRKVAQGVPPWGMAFGAGAHACPGRPLVTGSRNPMGKVGADGTLVSISRRFYGAGMELDPDRPLVRDPNTHYEIYSSVPIRFRKL
ncbi:MAG: cytochrome P450 [Betaproteobacteria bacterium]|nr:cytochrome P450 [Betaproteobacteria bacterium]